MLVHAIDDAGCKDNRQAIQHANSTDDLSDICRSHYSRGT